MAQHHLEPKEATIRSMGEISSSLIAVVLVMCSVFIPAAFLPGTTGQLYKQFAITIVISVSVSGFVALTLTPAMCAVMLKHTPPRQRGFFAWFNRQVDAVTRGFGHAVEWVIARAVVALVLLAVFLYAIWHLFHVLPTSFCRWRTRATRWPPPHRRPRPRAHAGDLEKADAIFGSPGVRPDRGDGHMLDSGFKTAGTLFITSRTSWMSATRRSGQGGRTRAILQGFFAKRG